VKKKIWEKNTHYPRIKRIFVLTLSRIHSNFYFFRKALKFLTYPLIIDSRFTELLKNKTIDKVLVDGPTSLWPINSYWIAASKKLGLETTTIITNWDHPTTRGYQSIDSNQYLVWGKSMKEEMIKYQDAKKDNVVEVGSILFDMYNDKSFILPINKLKTKNSQNIKNGYALVITNSPYYPYNLEIIKYLRKHIQSEIKLVIRLHPLYNDHYAKEELALHKDYDRVESNVVYFYPKSSSSALSADMSFEEIQLSASLIANAGVIVNSMSTMILDGLICNTPVVNIAFDWKKNVLIYLLASKQEYRIHLKRILKADGLFLAKNRKELISLINKLPLSKKLEYNKSNKAIIKNECGTIDGNASINIAKNIIN